MNVTEWMLVFIALVGAVANYLQQQEQNQIFREQNRIFADQGGKAMPPEKPRFIWWKRYWPTLITVLLFLLIGYDIYDRHHEDTSKWTDLDKLEHIAPRTFKDETVVLDGKYFIEPTFDRVTFLYNGTAGVGFENAHFVRPLPGQTAFKLGSRNNAVKTTLKIESALSEVAGCQSSVQNLGPIQMEGLTPPK